MSLLSRMAAPRGTDEVAALVTSVLSDIDTSVPLDLSALLTDLAAGPVSPVATMPPVAPAPHLAVVTPDLGMAAVRSLLPPAPVVVPPAEEVEVDDSMPPLFCPGPVRDNVALGEEVNERLVDWAEEVGIYPGQTERVRATNFGRLMMLTHPATDDPDRLLAAAKCVLAEWATDDHFLDDESLGADASAIGWRLGLANAAVDPAGLPRDYAPRLDDALAREPVAVAYQSAFAHLARIATPTQVTRLRRELTTMFMAYNHEASWRREGRIPPVWEYLMHRHQNSFLPPMVLVDPVAGYEIPSFEFADRRVRRVFALAGTASVILNDIYSMGSETDTDFDLPKVIAHEEGCSRREALRRTIEIHNELMHTFVQEAIILSAAGSLALRRFFTDIWAWLGGNRHWHATTPRYATSAA